MDFALTPEQRALGAAVAAAVAGSADPRAAYDLATPPVWDEALWRRLCDIGVPGLTVPEEFDGAGAGAVEAMLVCEHLGEQVAPVPVLGHLSAVEALRMGERRVAEAFLPDLAAGTRRAGYVPTGPGVDPLPHLGYTTEQGQYRLTGRVPLALDVLGADLLVVPGMGEVGPAWFLLEVDDTLGVRAQPSLDRTRPAAVIELDGHRAHRVDPPAPGRDGAGDVGGRSLALLRTLAAAEAVGAAAWALEQARAYALDREQFGLPIGTFQAVKHRLADMLVAVENARSATYGAAWALAHDAAALAATEVSMAQAVATAAGVRVVSDAIQLHGGIGVTWENDLHLRLRRAKTLQLLYGSPAWHREQVAAALLDS